MERIEERRGAFHLVPLRVSIRPPTINGEMEPFKIRNGPLEGP
jgi:hypothetical protein